MPSLRANFISLLILLLVLPQTVEACIPTAQITTPEPTMGTMGPTTGKPSTEEPTEETEEPTEPTEATTTLTTSTASSSTATTSSTSTTTTTTGPSCKTCTASSVTDETTLMPFLTGTKALTTPTGAGCLRLSVTCEAQSQTDLVIKLNSEVAAGQGVLSTIQQVTLQCSMEGMWFGPEPDGMIEDISTFTCTTSKQARSTSHLFAFPTDFELED